MKNTKKIKYLTLYIDRKYRMPFFNGRYISKTHILEKTDYFAQLVKKLQEIV